MAKHRSKIARNVEDRLLADGLPGYYYIAPRKARAAGVLQSRPLGRDRDAAMAIAADLNRILDAWRRGADLAAPAPLHGSLDWAIARFRELRDRPTKQRRKALSKTTKRDYDHYLGRLAELRLTDGRRLGEAQMAEIGRRDAHQIAAIFGKADARGVLTAPVTARNAVKAFRRLWTVVGRGELGLAGNPFARLGLEAKGRQGKTWRDDAVKVFVAAARCKDLPSLASAALLRCEQGWDPAEIRHLTWRDLEASRRAGFRSSPALAALLAEIKRRNSIALPRDLDRPVLLHEGSGQPYDAPGFRKAVAEVRKAAGLPDDWRFDDIARRSWAPGAAEDVAGHPGSGPAAARAPKAPAAQAVAAPQNREIQHRPPETANTKPPERPWKTADKDRTPVRADDHTRLALKET
jgi:hypothetical protein